MSIELVIGIGVLVAIFVIFFTNIGDDYSKRTDQQLLDLWSLHENNVRAARSVGPEAHKKAVEKMSTLTNEMKKRGMLKSDYTQESEALDAISRKLFSRGLDEIKSLAKANDAAALYQLGIIFRGVKEPSTSIKYMSVSANLGYVDAQYALGWAFMTEGSGVTRDACETMKWFRIAAEQGHVEAQKALDVVLKSFSRAEAEVAFAEAKEWLTRMSAEASHVGTKPQHRSTGAASQQGANNNALSAPCFKVSSGECHDPHSFGLFAVKTAIEDSQQAVDEMIGTGELPSQQSIRSKNGAVQLHLVALIAGVLYVCANKLSASNKQVLTEVASGLSDGFSALFSDENGKLSNPNNPRSLYELFEDYAGSLADELNDIDPETLGSDPLDMGATARLVVENIGGQCGVQRNLENSPLERVMLEKIAATYGASFLIRLLLEKHISYSR